MMSISNLNVWDAVTAQTIAAVTHATASESRMLALSDGLAEAQDDIRTKEDIVLENLDTRFETLRYLPEREDRHEDAAAAAAPLELPPDAGATTLHVHRESRAGGVRPPLRDSYGRRAPPARAV